MKLKLLTSILFLAFALPSFAQVKFEAEVSKDKLGINERLRVDFKMNEDGDNFNPPNFSGFEVVGGPNQAVSNSWINGKRSYSKTYSYFLQPTKRGKFTIAQAEITIEGETYKTVPITVEVTAAVENTEEAQINRIADENIHLVAEVSNANPFLNEAITVSYKLYVSPTTSVSNFREIDNPKYRDFWSQMIDNQPSQVQTGEYQGEQYRYVVLRKVVLYPQKSGKLEIEPLTLSVAVDVPTGKRDFFGGRLYTTVNKTVAAGKRTIDVKMLPQDGKPADFTGAVGRGLRFDVSASKNNLKTSESLDLTVEVRGTGNLKLFNLPQLTLPDALEVYEPQHSENIRTTGSGMNGSISDTYTVVPNRAGEYTIDPISFTYFDLETRSYRTLTSEPINLQVEKGPKVTGPGAAVATNKQTVELTGDNFRFIKLKTDLHAVNKEPFYNSATFWTLFAAPLLAVPLVVLFGRRREAAANDVHGNRVKRADKLAKKYLSDAKQNIGDQSAFYVSLERALHNYLKAKLHITTSEMSKENITELLKEKGVDQQEIANFIGLIKSCEMARYAPSSRVEMQQDYEKSVSVISALDKQL